MSHALFEPITLRGLTVRNRLWIPPMCQFSVEAQDGVATDWHTVHLGALAQGGTGAIILEATGVLPEGRISPQDLGLWNDEQRDVLAGIVDFVHAQGVAASIQLQHAGRKASTWREWVGAPTGTIPAADGGWEPLGPSPIAARGLVVPTELDRAGIANVVAGFVAAARRAVDAGFDMLELHGAHGYLLHQFLSPLSNRRTDEYGGSLSNRARALLETVDAMRAEIGADVPIIVRLSATDWVEGGITLDETIQVVRWLGEHGVDLIDVTTGGLVPAKIPVGPGYQVAFAAAIKAATDVPVAAVGLITEPAQAEQIVVTGQADVVLVGRESLRNPHFPLRAAAELGYDAPYLPSQYGRAYR